MAGVTAKFKTIAKFAAELLLCLFLVGMPLTGQVHVLHDFNNIAADGATPLGGLVLSGNILYGMTSQGGSGKAGTIFKMDVDGENYSILHEFTGGPDDGGSPKGSLLLSGTTLFGMTEYGGDSNDGTIFRIETDGTNFSLLHEFSGGYDDGGFPCGSLIISGSTLYGMTRHGGDVSSGTIFKIETNGSGFTIMHEFLGGADDGAYPDDSLLLVGSTLHGLTYDGGDAGKGTLFKIETDGSGFALLHEFAEAPGDGESPEGSLATDGSVLFGTTLFGGTYGEGTIFKIKVDGDGYSLLHEFSGGTGDGLHPIKSLILSGSKLYGSAFSVAHEGGVIFQLKTDGSEFMLLHGFDRPGKEGSHPNSPLLIFNSFFYGMMAAGGSLDFGVVFSHPVPPYIFMDSPNGGESWPKGSSQQIAWKSPGVGGNARLVLFRNGVKTGVIATVPAAQGSYGWAAGAYIGGSAPAAKNYKIKIVSTDGTYSDWSDANFALTLASYIRLIAPNGGESWPLGGTRRIAWDARGLTGNMRLVLFSGNSKVGAIATLPVAAGGLDWTVGEFIGGTASAGSNYRIRIVALDAALSDFSDGSFAMTTD